MSQFKKDLLRELQPMSLSAEKKQLIATKSKAKVHNQKRRVNWQYRIVLATFTVFALGFGYLLRQQGDSANSLQGASPDEALTTINWSILDNDILKTILFFSFFIVLRFLLKRGLRKRGKGLPVCVECGEEWSYREALKQSMKNGGTTCPYCTKKQYRTKKSVKKTAMLNFFIPFITLVPHLFTNILLGIVVYAICAAYMLFSLSPYYMELQEDDPINEPFW
ncbi:TIGR04104 family putative zinc finger protein [Filibacter tadaridae]|uniref:Cxxc_20_cxxc protein n=1 Tax=Filibacter tadaridae TaxID=2483811 RepID=A0A3P5X5T0_9BACL|nr:TIGR04104 family putative zinc finger protein [Filibacter tadaridae]VDC22624.1 hypothetical protein FILTAD_00814 [Filibacter tadaridae]